MKAQLQNLADTKKTEINHESTVLCRKMESHLMELRSMIQYMSDMHQMSCDGLITAEEGVERYLKGLRGLVEVAGKQDLLDSMLLQMKRRAEYEKLTQFAENW
jgi:hypothetical protein